MKIQLVIPVYNEENRLGPCLEKLIQFVSTQPEDYRIIVANNGSTDRTCNVAKTWETRSDKIEVVQIPEKGRGRALKLVWSQSQCEILSYMDVDLSTDLAAYPRMIEALSKGEQDLAVGSRLLSGSKTSRCFKREWLSRGYNFLLKTAFHTHFSDAQCGFKAITRAAAAKLLPMVEDNHWFFDTELLVLAEKQGYRILDCPVHWIENRDSRVKIWRTILEDVKGIARLRRKIKV